MKLLAYLLCIVISMYSCHDKDQVPPNILTKEKMQDVMWSLISAGEFINGYVILKDSIDKVSETEKIYGRVFQFHKISREDFERSYTYYKQHPEIMRQMM